MEYLLKDVIKEYSEKNTNNFYEPVAVGKYGIRKRNEIYKKELSNDYSKNKIIRKDTMIIGMGSTQIDFGVLSKDETYSVSPAYHTFTVDSSIIKSDYFDLLLKAKNEEYTKKYMVASARQGKTVNIKDFVNEKINIPPFEEQNKIIDDISEIRKIICLGEKQLELYDELIKSRFIGQEDCLC